eukprot:8334275-Lingulodinium_polyedra.AAC.1
MPRALLNSSNTQMNCLVWIAGLNVIMARGVKIARVDPIAAGEPGRPRNTSACGSMCLCLLAPTTTRATVHSLI